MPCLQETSSAQYILQQYMAASGGQKLQGIANAYAMGKLKMLASDLETATKVIKNRNSSKTPDSGGFVLWQMNPDMWYIELALGSNEVHAGSNGSLVWRHTPWLGTHAAKGPVRPLRRALQVIDSLCGFINPGEGVVVEILIKASVLLVGTGPENYCQHVCQCKMHGRKEDQWRGLFRPQTRC